MCRGRAFISKLPLLLIFPSGCSRRWNSPVSKPRVYIRVVRAIRIVTRANVPTGFIVNVINSIDENITNSFVLDITHECEHNII